MKKLLLFVLTSLFVGGALFAQTNESGKVKNEGNAAWRAKNYKEAFTKWEQYLKLIEFKDDATVYNVAVCATKLKDYANAEKNFQIALEKDPNLTDALSNIGRIYYNQGVNKLSEANMINDSKKYQEELGMAKDLFKKALPYYKKAHEAEPEKMDNMIALRGIYYNLNMGPELEAIEAEMNK